MIVHDKCGKFEEKILELEKQLKEKEATILDMQKHIDCLCEQLKSIKDSGDDEHLQC